jgi:murein DD-endopeptidase MepM/ murein hydrolase activator NlpD
MINHGQGVMTIYLHMDSIGVTVRQKVHKGQVIGKVGSTGLATAPHVHFQVFVHGVPVDPKQWMETEF